MLEFQFPFIIKYLKNKESWVLYLAMFVMGACGLAYEYTLSKVASDILGNSVRQWAIIIGVMMFFMGVGADIQKYLPDKFLVDQFIIFEILLGLIGAFGPVTFIYAFGQAPMYFVLIQYFFIISIGLIIGFEIPLITRINESYINELKVNLAGVLKMDYVGSLAGALIWIFLLPVYFEQVQAAFLLGMLNVFVAFITYLFFRDKIKNNILILLVLIVTASTVLYGFINAPDWRVFAEQHLYRDKLIYTKTTRYQHIVLTESRSGDVSCYINGHLQFNTVDENIYHENLVHPVFAIAHNRENILILGGGDGLALREVLKYRDVKKVILVDIDPEMTRLARNNETFKNINNNSFADSRLMVIDNNALIPADTTKLIIRNRQVLHGRESEKVAEVEIINVDALHFVDQVSGIFDLIILDFPDPNAPDLANLYSTQFYSQVKKKLARDGLIAVQSTSPYHAKEVFLSIGRTLNDAGISAIPYKDNVPTFGEWGWWIGGHDDRSSFATIMAKLSNIDSIEVNTKYLTGSVIKSNLIFGKDQLKTQETEINTIANQKAYFYYLHSWQN